MTPVPILHVAEFFHSIGCNLKSNNVRSKLRIIPTEAQEHLRRRPNTKLYDGWKAKRITWTFENAFHSFNTLGISRIYFKVQPFGNQNMYFHSKASTSLSLALACTPKWVFAQEIMRISTTSCTWKTFIRLSEMETGALQLMMIITNSFKNHNYSKLVPRWRTSATPHFVFRQCLSTGWQSGDRWWDTTARWWMMKQWTILSYAHIDVIPKDSYLW